MPGMSWPAVCRPETARSIAVLNQMLYSQWWTENEVKAAQHRQLIQLLRHAFAHVPFYRDRLRDLSKSNTLDEFQQAWQELPLLSRSDIQDHGPDLQAATLPDGHGPGTWSETSGTSGKPVRVLLSALYMGLQAAGNLRGYYWRQWDFGNRFACIRADKKNKAHYPDGTAVKGWGSIIAPIFRSGPGYYLDIHTDPSLQAEWLSRREPDYLMTYASNAMHVAQYCLDHDIRVESLKSLELVSETVTPEIRAVCEKAWGARVFANYGTREAGTVALECPDTGVYHTQAELVLVEVLHDDGRPCAVGETGRVVLTPLHNFAMPLLRYDIGDYAEVGEVCSCGRGLPVLRRVHGRQNELLHLPNGERFWLPFHGEVLTAVAPVRQYQIIQHGLDDIEVRLVVDGELSPDQEERLTARLQEDFRHPFPIRYTYVPSIPRSAGGKYQIFVSKIA